LVRKGEKIFCNHAEAAQKLSQALELYRGQDIVICGIPPGGAVLAALISKLLNAPFGVIVSLALSHPFDSSLSVGAVAPDGHLIKNSLDEIFIDSEYLRDEITRKHDKAKKDQHRYEKFCHAGSVSGKTVLLVDDHIGTGLTFSLAISELLHMDTRKIVAVIPVVPFMLAEKIRDSVDLLITLEMPLYDSGLSQFALNYGLTGDDEAIELIKKVKSHCNRD
jgi:putative phosphoribosyl transferase